MFKRYFLIISSLLFFVASQSFAQPKANDKYPSLLWEITGNGLTRPSYLFGTMHVSSKMVFHLSDSFYHAIKNVDAVALELNPDVWQGQMARMDELKENYASFVQQAGNDYLTENSFRIKNYIDELKSALQTEPAVVNNLLYRSYKAKEDFEEDTFLDLYIFQTGRKLGKKAAGVENYFEAEKIILEAYADMAKEKKKKTSDLDAGFLTDYVEKIQNAYRKGDLDLMDSLDNVVEQSAAFREKFLYKRNEIQANSIDSIIRHTSLFAGVGAAHLPGNRGVIELLRKKGYTLKPVKMAARNAQQKNSIDVLHVPVVFKKKQSEDIFYTVDVPGDLYNVRQDYQSLDRRQYADMSNGSYYMVTRVRTHAAFIGQTEKEVLKKVDSVLYENIPGKILSKKAIVNNGYSGYDISSKTRRGDLQRYQIFVTAFEIIIFKMSGKENYVAGKEANQFFSSIALKEKENKPLDFQPTHGGFGIRLPQMPNEYLNNLVTGSRWEYEAVDKASGDAYLVFKKSLYNFNFIEEDSFDLALVEESFRSPDYFDKQVSRKFSSFNGFPSLEVEEKLKSGATVKARYFINGPHYYVLAKRIAAAKPADDLLSTFSFKPYKYSASKPYVDTFLKASVNTFVVPEIDEGMRSLIEQALESAANGNNYSGYISYWQKPKNGVFRSDSTGEVIAVQVQEFPKYYYIKDSAKYWQDEIKALFKKRDMYLNGKVTEINEKDFSGVSFTLRDTGSSRSIHHMLLLKNNFMYNISTIGDTIQGPGELGKAFFSSFKPVQNTSDKNIYANKLPLFFNDLFSKDSTVLAKAQQSVANIYYGVAGIPMIMDAINRTSISDKDYFNIKSKLIAELGYIRDTTSNVLVSHLKNIYEQTADTALFQNEVIKALARIKTKAGYLQLKEIFLKEPPIFENNYDYNNIFSNIEDSLSLSKILFPELMQLVSLSDYKEKIIELLVELVDSGYVKQSAYKDYFPSIYIDAVVALKKQRSKDEKQMQTASKEIESDDPVRLYDYNKEGSNLSEYAILLMPFYEGNKNVQSFFAKMLQSRDEEVKLKTAILMLRHNKEVPDSIITKLAANDRYTASLYLGLKKANKLNRFPAQYKNQLNIARALLLRQNEYDKMDSIVYLSKQPITEKGKKGMVYFFKYRVKRTDQWRIGISGMQPLDSNDIGTDNSLVSLTGVKLKDTQPIDEQLNEQLKKIFFAQHKSGKNFFEESEDYSVTSMIEDVED